MNSFNFGLILKFSKKDNFTRNHDPLARALIQKSWSYFPNPNSFLHFFFEREIIIIITAKKNKRTISNRLPLLFWRELHHHNTNVSFLLVCGVFLWEMKQNIFRHFYIIIIPFKKKKKSVHPVKCCQLNYVTSIFILLNFIKSSVGVLSVAFLHCV